jgi:pimeloyl-ACP methyl ester carboxylesterase
MFPPAADANLVGWVAAKISSANPEVAVSSLRNLGQYNLLQPLQNSSVPVHSISADFWPTDFETNKKYVQSFEVKIIPGVGHFVMLEDPNKFNRFLDEILNEVGK